jgi:C-terminal processing protease CtpA/Prc
VRQIPQAKASTKMPEVENFGVEPDVAVAYSPTDYLSETDPQLDRAIVEALESVVAATAASRI